MTSRPWIGLNAAMTQDGRAQVDGAVAIMLDEVIHCLPEEVISRKRHDGNVWRALAHTLDGIDGGANGVDTYWVSTCGEPVPKTEAPVFLRTDGRFSLQDLGVTREKIRWRASHHESHAWEALYAASNAGTLATPCLIYVADRVGQPGEHQSIFLFEPRTGLCLLHRDSTVPGQLAGIGLTYDRVTRHLGWRENFDAGKTMALAGLADPRNGPSDNLLEWSKGGIFSPISLEEKEATEYLKKWCRSSPDDQTKISLGALLAARLQSNLENVVNQSLLPWVSEYRAKMVLFSGGLATNCKLLGAIRTRFCDQVIHGSLAPGDTGQAIGNLVGAFFDTHGRLPRQSARGGYWSLHVPDPATVSRCETVIEPLAQGRSLIVPGTEPEAISIAAQGIMRGDLVAIIEPYVEPGPRALGFHSFLADARDPEMPSFLNAYVKFRDPFQPYGAIMLIEEAQRYFGKNFIAPFMDVAPPAPIVFRERYPGSIHQDGSARIQTLSSAQQGCFVFRVMEKLKNEHGLYAIINTSLNTNNMPIIIEREGALITLCGQHKNTKNELNY